MKKNFICILVFLLVFSFSFLGNTTVNAARGTASVKGFEIESLNYETDYQSEYVEIKTADNYYGKIRLWTAIYSVYDSYDNTKYFAVLFEAEICSSTFRNLVKTFSNKRIVVNVGMDYSIYTMRNANVINFKPNTNNYNGSYTVNSGVSIGADQTNGFNASVSFAVTSEIKEISLTTILDDLNMFYYFDFKRYADNQAKLNSPYSGTYIQQGVVWFQIDNFSENDFNQNVIDVVYEGFIFKDHWIKNETLSKTVHKAFTYNSSLGKYQ